MKDATSASKIAYQAHLTKEKSIMTKTKCRVMVIADSRVSKERLRECNTLYEGS